MKYLFIALLLVSFRTASIAKSYGKISGVEVVTVYDGDTFSCNIKNYPELIGKNISIRIAGIDTPEKNDDRPEIRELAMKARKYVIDRLASAKEIELRNVRRGKYFRIIAEVWLDGKCLADELLELKLARPYSGGKRTRWSDIKADREEHKDGILN